VSREAAIAAATKRWGREQAAWLDRLARDPEAVGTIGLNGLAVETGDDALTELMVGVATGSVPKSEIAVFLQRHGRAVE
jgi:hypothetical protein